LRPNCEWLEWEWLNSTYEPTDGNLVLSKFTIRVVGKSFKTACLDVPLAIYIVFAARATYWDRRRMQRQSVNFRPAIKPWRADIFASTYEII